MTGPELLGGRSRMEDITLEKLDKSDLKAVLVKVYDHNRSDSDFIYSLPSLAMTTSSNNKAMNRNKHTS